MLECKTFGDSIYKLQTERTSRLYGGDIEYNVVGKGVAFFEWQRDDHFDAPGRDCSRWLVITLIVTKIIHRNRSELPVIYSDAQPNTHIMRWNKCSRGIDFKRGKISAARRWPDPKQPRWIETINEVHVSTDEQGIRRWKSRRCQE